MRNAILTLARKWLPVFLILWLAFGLRLHRLEAQSFWNDEGNSARLSERPLPAIIEGTASDIHPPLYYLLLRGWREGAGDSEFGLRGFSTMAGLLTVAAAMALGKRLHTFNRKGRRGRKGGGGQKNITRAGGLGNGRHAWIWLAGLLTAVSPPLIYYSQETRMYALLALEAILATVVLVNSNQLTVISKQLTVNGKRKTDHRSPTTDHRSPTTDHRSLITDHRSPITDHRSLTTVAYTFTLTAGLYTHYFFPAVLVGHGLLVGGWAAARRRWRVLGWWLGSVAVALLLYLPWLPIFLRQAGGRGGVRGSLLDFLGEAGRWLAVGRTLPETAALWPLAAAGAGLMVLAAFLARPRRAALLLLLATTPLLFAFAAGTTQPQFYKFLLTAVPFFTLLLALGAAGGRRAATALAGLGALLLLAGVADSLDNLYNDPAFARADYRGMADQIEAEDHPDAGIILDAPNQWEVFTYYYPRTDNVYPLPRGGARPDLIEPELEAITARHERLYAIFWGEAQRDPERLVERWLDAHAFKAREEWRGDVRFVTYAVPEAAAQQMETAVSTQFGSDITLRGYTLRDTAVLPGDIIQITLFWETAVPLSERYKVFLHLVDESGRPVAQRDSEPGGGLALTPTWQPGEVIRDNHGILIPADLPPGDYALLVGLYRIDDPTARLSIHHGSSRRDTLPLATIEVIKRNAE